ncbi:MAG: XdhC family protein, partial [Acidobacteriota bacterium]|nr:XdhC family protein [Acidobacteriota bacterium]
MKEIQEILDKISQLARGEKAILATVADVVGSGYRRPGARMLIDENGYSIGTVSGGCLEADVLERAKRVLQTGEPTVVTYDTTKDENSVFGLNMGCRGVVRILLEPFENKSILLDILRIAAANRKRQFIGTIISSNGNSMIGGRIFFDDNGIFDFENLSEGIKNSKELKADSEKFFTQNRLPEVREYSIGENFFEIFFENINPPLNLLLFGAGYDALPLINFAREIGWRVTAIDHRAAFANAERLFAADEIIVSSSEDLREDLFNDENSVAVIMTHNYERDRNILRRLLHSKCVYIGALGPKKRAENLLAEIGETFSDEQLKRLYAPVGLDIGADTPEEIALAVVA